MLTDLLLRTVEGRGIFGVAKLCYHWSDEQRVCTLKCASEEYVVKQDQQKSICSDQGIYALLSHLVFGS